MKEKLQPKIKHKAKQPKYLSPFLTSSKGGHSSSESCAVAGCGGEEGVLAGNGGPVVGSGLEPAEGRGTGQLFF